MAAKSTDQLREEWNKLAGSYAQRVSQITTKFYRAMLPFMQLAQARVVVEAGCGPGNGVDILREQLPVDAKVLANDIAAGFVEIVRGKGLPNVEVVEAVNEALPYADCIADRYIANMCLHLVEFPDRMVAEAFRVLKPGSIAAFSIMGDRAQSSLTNIALQLREKYATQHFRSPFHLSDLSALKQLLTAAGFSRVITLEELYYIPKLDSGLLEGNILQHPLVVTVYEGLEEGRKERLRDDLRGLVEAVLQRQQKPVAVHARIAIAFKS